MMPAFQQVRGNDNDDRADFPRPIGRDARADERARPLLVRGPDAASSVSGHNLVVGARSCPATVTGRIGRAVLTPS